MNERNEAREEASARVSRVIQKLTAPAENVITHLERIGAPHWVAQPGAMVYEPSLIVPYDSLVKAELGALQGSSPVAEYINTGEQADPKEAIRGFLEGLKNAAQKQQEESHGGDLGE